MDIQNLAPIRPSQCLREDIKKYNYNYHVQSDTDTLQTLNI